MFHINFKAWDGKKVCGVKNIKFADKRRKGDQQ